MAKSQQRALRVVCLSWPVSADGSSLMGREATLSDAMPPGFALHPSGAGSRLPVVVAASRTHAVTVAARAGAAITSTDAGGSGADCGGVVGKSLDCWSWGSGEHGCLGCGEAPRRPVLPSCSRVVLAPRYVHRGGSGDGSGAGGIDHGVASERGECRGNWANVGCGDGFTLLVDRSGRVHSCGRGGTAQLGLGFPTKSNTANRLFPTPVMGVISGMKITQVACGASHSLAVCADGRLFSWGVGRWGVLGLGDARARFQPAQVEIGKDVRIAKVAAGESHSAALSTSGAVYAWGKAKDGRLGLRIKQLIRHASRAKPGKKRAKRTSEQFRVVRPHLVEGPLSLHKVHTIACGRGHTLALAVNGMVFSAGQSAGGQLGRPKEPADEELSLVASLHGHRIQSVHAAADYSCFVERTGNVLWCGQLPLGKTPAPMPVSELRGLRVVGLAAAPGRLIAATAPTLTSHSAPVGTPAATQATKRTAVATLPKPKRLRK